MPEERELRFNRADAPIKSIENDLLERATFAIDIANSIRNWSSSESLVIGISGRWGEGKTSVLNMVKEALVEDFQSIEDVRNPTNSPHSVSHERQPEDIQILEFRPWQFTGIEVITRSLFQDLGQKIGQADESVETEELSIRIKQLGELLSTVGGVQPGGTLTWRSQIAFSILGGFLLGVPWASSMPIWILVISTVVGTAAVVAPWFKQTAEFLQDQSKIEEKTTSELREDVARGLEERDHPLVVLIDDVDRLTTEEVKLLFQLVRSSASFPNVVYVMGLDVDRIRRKLDDEGIDKDYLDKIIQEVYDLPRIPEGRIDDYAKTRILSDELLGADAVERELPTSPNKRWDIAFGAASNSYFDTLRDVNRFLSAFQLQVGRFTRRNTFEANVVDLFALHILREFERPVFQNLLESKYLLCQAPGPPIADIESLMEHEEGQGGREAPASSREEKLDEIVSQPEDDEAVRAILAVLFPYAAKYLLENGRSGNHHHINWILERRIAHPFYFRAYFEQRPAERPLSKREEGSLRGILHDSQKLQDKLEEWGQSNRLLEGLHFLRAFVHKGVLKEHEQKTIIEAFRCQEELLNEDQSREGTDGLDLLDEPNVPSQTAEDTIHEILRRADSESETRELIEALLDSPPAFRFARSALHLVQNENHLSDSTLKSLRKKYANTVAKVAKHWGRKTRKIYDRDDFAELIILWFKWGDTEDATDWLENQIEVGKLPSVAARFVLEEEGLGKKFGDHVEFKSELLGLLDGTLSVRDLRKKALEVTSEAATEGMYKETNWGKVLNALEELLED